MGCDIHFCIEKRVTKYDDEVGEHVPVEPARWVGVYGTWYTPALLTRTDRLPTGPKADRGAMFERTPAMKGRNYDFFAKLAGVRGDGPDPKGFPEDASELAREMTDPDGGYDHSHSYDTLEAFILTWLVATDERLAAHAVGEKLSGEAGLVHYVAGLYDGIEHYRVVYWFDN